MVWVTGSTLNVFDKARIKLTILYACITIFIIAIFSVILLFSLEKNIRDTIHEEVERPKMRQEVYRKNINDVENTILYLDLILLFVVTGISYVLAGKTLQPIKNALDAQKRFTADASHDLRTPLAIMKTEIEVGLSDRSSYEYILKSNLEEINKMSLLVADLLSVARSEKDIDKKDFQTIDSNSFLHKVVGKFETQAQDKGLSLTFENSVSKKIKINLNTFERAIQNILQNAIHYTKTGGTIHVKTKLEKSHLILEIRDSGVGISKKDLPYIFERFYKAEHSRNNESGSGLGLSIAKQIIENNGGNIEIKSEIGVGTTVKITL